MRPLVQRLLLTLVFALISVNSLALELPSDASAPDQAQLTTLMSGNTLDGVWAGRPFRQYFAASGSTQYREGDGPSSTGSWWVSSDGHYCSVWPPSSREACYEVLVSGKQVFWKSGDEYYPSEVKEGKLF